MPKPSTQHLSDEDMSELVMIVRTNTAASRLSESETIAMFRALEDNDVSIGIPEKEDPPVIETNESDDDEKE